MQHGLMQSRIQTSAVLPDFSWINRFKVQIKTWLLDLNIANEFKTSSGVQIYPQGKFIYYIKSWTQKYPAKNSNFYFLLA